MPHQQRCRKRRRRQQRNHPASHVEPVAGLCRTRAAADLRGSSAAASGRYIDRQSEIHGIAAAEISIECLLSLCILFLNSSLNRFAGEYRFVQPVKAQPEQDAGQDLQKGVRVEQDQERVADYDISQGFYWKEDAEDHQRPDKGRPSVPFALGRHEGMPEGGGQEQKRELPEECGYRPLRVPAENVQGRPEHVDHHHVRNQKAFDIGKGGPDQRGRRGKYHIGDKASCEKVLALAAEAQHAAEVPQGYDDGGRDGQGPKRPGDADVFVSGQVMPLVQHYIV